jgi:stress response protein YsnF
MSNSSTPVSEQDSLRVPITEEVLSIEKRVVDTGRGVRVQKTVQTLPVVIDETLASEEINVKHVPIDRTLEKDELMPGTRYDGDILIVPVFEEIVVVERRIRLKEELHITRIRREEPFVETVMLKSEQVSIERFDESGES